MKPYSDVKKIYGPYISKQDGRSRVLVYYHDGTRTTVSYPKYLMEIHLERYLKEDEEIDHKDGDFTNNEISNFQILTRVEHAKLDSLRGMPIKFICQICLNEFEISGKRLSDYHQNKFRVNSGPYCNKSCAGKASHRRDLKVIIIIIPREYYTNKNN